MPLKVSSSFEAGDRVVYSDKYGVEERGVILAVYPYDGSCTFQADGIYNATQRVAASNLILNGAGRVSDGCKPPS